MTEKMMVGMKAPQFEGLQDYKGKTLILFFYPLNFGMLAADELNEMEKHREELEKMNCSVIVILPSLSAALSLLRTCWLSSLLKEEFHPRINFPLCTDTNGEIALQYGVEAKHRGCFLIDQEGIIRAKVNGDLTDMVNKVKEIQGGINLV